MSAVITNKTDVEKLVAELTAKSDIGQAPSQWELLHQYNVSPEFLSGMTRLKEEVAHTNATKPIDAAETLDARARTIAAQKSSLFKPSSWGNKGLAEDVEKVAEQQATLAVEDPRASHNTKARAALLMANHSELPSGTRRSAR